MKLFPYKDPSRHWLIKQRTGLMDSKTRKKKQKLELSIIFLFPARMIPLGLTYSTIPLEGVLSREEAP